MDQPLPQLLQLVVVLLLMPLRQLINLDHSPCIIHLTSVYSVLEVVLLLSLLSLEESLMDPSLVELDIGVDTNTKR